MDKACEFENAAPGISGLETAFGLLMSLVRDGKLTLEDLIAALTSRAATAWGLPYGTLANGAAADVVVLDTKRAWVVNTHTFQSKGKNSPLQGQALTGAVLLTIAEGRVAYCDPVLEGKA
jgi:dihydroorotase